MCLPIPLLALGLTAVSTVVGIKQSNDAKQARNDAAMQQRTDALNTKSKADQKLRTDRNSGYRATARTGAGGYTAQPDTLFGPRSFFAGG